MERRQVHWPGKTFYDRPIEGTEWEWDGRMSGVVPVKWMGGEGGKTGIRYENVLLLQCYKYFDGLMV